MKRQFVITHTRVVAVQASSKDEAEAKARQPRTRTDWSMESMEAVEAHEGGLEPRYDAFSVPTRCNHRQTVFKP